jgi:hypothetical protein
MIDLSKMLVFPDSVLVIQLRDEETKNEDRKRKEQAKQRADRKRHEELHSRKSSLELTDDAGFMDVSTFFALNARNTMTSLTFIVTNTNRCSKR